MTPAANDPRRSHGDGEADARPVVGGPPRGIPVWVMAIGVALLAIVLFSVLNARRLAVSAPPVRARTDDQIVATRSPPPLLIPPEPVAAPLPVIVPPPIVVPAAPAPPPYRPPPRPQIVYAPPPPPTLAPPPQAVRASNDSAVVLDVGGVAAASSTGGNEPPARLNVIGGDGPIGSASAAAPARATVMRHRRTTVAQGTLIPATLETALDSTRPGLARAVVASDVRGFDGSTVLVPRGSRLFGEYRGALQPGQNRALIVWNRLVRPDGVSIAIASPVSDTLGRAGVRGKVNTHFLERFGAAILQSTLEVGVGLASRLGNNNNSVVVALPGASAALSQPFTQAAQVAPTLRVRQGASVSVFVARDLDFTAVENRR